MNYLNKTRKLGKHQRALLAYLRGYSGGHTLTDAYTIRIANTLIKRQLIVKNEYNQYMYIGDIS